MFEADVRSKGRFEFGVGNMNSSVSVMSIVENVTVREVSGRVLVYAGASDRVPKKS